MDSDVDEEKPKSADVIRNVEDSSLHVARCNLLILSSAGLGDQTFVRNPSFALVQEEAFSWACGHNKWCSETDKDSKKTFEEKDVAPCLDDHGIDSPWRDTGQSGRYLLDFLRWLPAALTYPVARSPPNAPAILAAET